MMDLLARGLSEVLVKAADRSIKLYFERTRTEFLFTSQKSLNIKYYTDYEYFYLRPHQSY